MTPQPENPAQDDVAVIEERLRAGQRVAVNDPRHRYRADYFTDGLIALDRLSERIARLERERDIEDLRAERNLECAEATEARVKELERERDILFKGDWAALNLRAEAAEAHATAYEEALRELVEGEPDDIDPRLDYVYLQVDRDAVVRARAALDAGKDAG
jgi:hypothetical protein